MGEPKTKPEGKLKVPCLVYSRIVGYLRPVQYWHKSKRQEFRDRKVFIKSKLRDAEGDDGG